MQEPSTHKPLVLCDGLWMYVPAGPSTRGGTQALQFLDFFSPIAVFAPDGNTISAREKNELKSVLKNEKMSLTLVYNAVFGASVRLISFSPGMAHGLLF